MTYTEALVSVQSGLSWLGWLSVGLSAVDLAALVVGWVWVRDRLADLARGHAAIEQALQHPSLDARALTDAQVSVDEAVREIQAARGEIRELAGVAREVAAAAGVEHVTAAGPARG